MSLLVLFILVRQVNYKNDYVCILNVRDFYVVLKDRKYYSQENRFFWLFRREELVRVGL